MVVYCVMFAGPKEIKDIFSNLKDSVVELSQSNTTLKHQVWIHIHVDWTIFSFFFVPLKLGWIGEDPHHG